jgi:hypothetical protein
LIALAEGYQDFLVKMTTPYERPWNPQYSVNQTCSLNDAARLDSRKLHPSPSHFFLVDYPALQTMSQQVLLLSDYGQEVGGAEFGGRLVVSFCPTSMIYLTLACEGVRMA